jgi:hypothetical protein
VAQVGDGLVALPHDARTKEHLEWVAATVIEADGEAIVWIATPSGRRASDDLAQEMRDARDIEYTKIMDEVGSTDDTSSRTIQRWRRQWRRIDRRDYFRSAMRDESRLAIAALVDQPDAETVKR